MTSVGDVLVLIDLTNKLANLLKDSINSPTEFREVILDLNSLSSVLDTFHRLVSGSDSPRLQSLTCNEVNLALCRSKTLINNFMAKTEGYHDTFKPGGSGNLFRDTRRKIFWAYYMSKKVVELKRKLLEQQAVIDLILSFSNYAALDRIEHIAQQNHTTLVAMHNVMRQPSQAMEQYLLLWLVDIRGTVTPFPMGFCTDWDTFNEALKLYFKGKVGQKYVDRGDYDLTTHGDTEIITPATWNSQIRAGITVDMNAILRLQASCVQRCPNCGRSTSDVAQNGGKLTCTACQTSFRASDGPTEEVGEDERSEPDHDDSSPTQQSMDIKDETCFLRRFHVILITVVSPRHSEHLISEPEVLCLSACKDSQQWYEGQDEGSMTTILKTDPHPSLKSLVKHISHHVNKRVPKGINNSAHAR